MREERRKKKDKVSAGPQVPGPAAKSQGPIPGRPIRAGHLANGTARGLTARPTARPCRAPVRAA